MGFADDVKEIKPKLDAVVGMIGFLTPENIQLIHRFMEINFDEIEKTVFAANKIKAKTKNLRLVENGLHDINKVAGMENQVSVVAKNYEKIGLVAGNLKDINSVCDARESMESVLRLVKRFEIVIAMKDDIHNAIDMKDDIGLQLGSLKEIKEIRDEMFELQIQASNASSLAADMLNKINVKEKIINEKLSKIEKIEKSIHSLDITIKHVDENTNPSSHYNPIDNILLISVPSGKTGPQGKGKRGFPGVMGIPGSATKEGKPGERGLDGKNFRIDIYGTKRELSKFGNRPVGTSFLTLDEMPTMIYFKKSNATNDWTDGQPFGVSTGETRFTAVNSDKLNGYTANELIAHIKKKMKG